MKVADFTQWIKNVDKHMVATFGLHHDDLPDALWRDRFEDGLSPLDAIEAAVEDEWSDYPEMEDLWYG